MEDRAPIRIWPFVRTVVMAGSILVGAAIAVSAVALGSCSAFGGRCPADAPPLWDDDVFRFAALGAVIAVGPSVFLTRSGPGRWWIAIGSAVGAGVVVGLIARSIAHG